MNLFALVRHTDDLDRARDEMSRFFSFRKERDSGCAFGPLLGIWIEPRMVQDIPAALLMRPSAGESQPVQVCESVGVSGVWALCRLETERVGRPLLLEALLRASSATDREVAGRKVSAGRFIPVLQRSAEEGGSVQNETHVLSRRHAEEVGAPWYQDPLTGCLAPAS